MRPSPALLREEDETTAVQRVHMACHSVSRSVQTRARCGAASSTKRILRNVTASFPPGQLCALMGPSGAGKTTLLSALRTGRVDGGFVTVNGAPFGAQLSGGGQIVTIPQDDVLLPGLTPLELLGYSARLRGVSVERFVFFSNTHFPHRTHPALATCRQISCFLPFF